MYEPKHFQETNPEKLHEIIKNYPLATLIIPTENDLEINHIPLRLESNTLVGHVAKVNPVNKLDSSKCTVIFHGPSEYISPSLYPSKKVDGKVVPTYNYVVVHVKGTLSLISDKEWLLNHVSDSTSLLESSSWKVSDAPSSYLSLMLKAITGIKIEIDSMVGKFKLSQNRPLEDLSSVKENVSAEMSSLM